MSLSEATQLLLQAGLQGKGGEILVLDMGEPVRIVDLARDMIRLSGADPDRIPIVFTGPAPRREALRGAARLRGDDAADAAPEAAHRAGARGEPRRDRPDGRVVRARSRRRRRRSARATQDVDSRVRAARRRAGAADPGEPAHGEPLLRSPYRCARRGGADVAGPRRPHLRKHVFQRDVPPAVGSSPQVSQAAVPPARQRRRRLRDVGDGRSEGCVGDGRGMGIRRRIVGPIGLRWRG